MLIFFFSMNIAVFDVGFTLSLDNRVRLSDNDGNQIDVVVRINGSVIYETKVYAVNGIGYFYDLGNLVHEYMRDNLLSNATLKVSANYESHTDSIEVFVIYSTLRTSYEVDLDFLTSHFLTTRSFYTIPRGKDLMLSYFSHISEQEISGHLNITFQLSNGEVMSRIISESISINKDTKMNYVYINSKSIETKLHNLYPQDYPKVLGGTIVEGERSLDFFFTDEQPVEVFSFLNAFNVWEYYYVYGKQTVKTEFKQGEGVVSGTAQFYNQSTEQKVQVETVPLSIEEALWMNEFLGSKRIIKVIPPDNDREILLSDITSEISDSAKQLVTIKFSWKYADPYTWKIFEENT